MGRLIEIVKAFMEQDEWHPRQDRVEGHARLYTRFNTRNGVWNFVVVEDERREIVTFLSILDVKCTPERYLALADFLTRANFGLKVGNFELDVETGKIRFRNSIDVEGGELTATMVKNAVYANVRNMADYFSGIMSVLYGGRSPEEAIARIEGGGQRSRSSDDAGSPSYT